MIGKYFTRDEFKCKCNLCEFDCVDKELLEVLDEVRENFDRAITITSGNRCISHNHSVGGATKSKHLYGIACDFKVDGVSSDEVYEYLDNKYPDKYGIGRYDGRTHIDVREDKARWDKRSING
jgi:uncharacterized protein YcbK (DUF882 family)